VIRAFIAFIYGSTPAEFKSAFGLSESVARLQAATRRWAFGVLAQPAAAGLVSESRVRLQRVIPMVGNSFKPCFYGRFDERNGGVYLIGRFTMLAMVKIFMTVWLGTVLAFGITFAVIQPGNWHMIIGALGMLGAGIALVGVGKWFARNDIAWLSNVIRGALGTSPVPQASDLSPQTASTPNSSSALPTALRLAAIFLLLMGVMCIGSAISGISSWRGSPGRTATTHFFSQGLRVTIGAYGLYMLGLAFGVYRRKRWAWLLGLVLIGASGLTTILQAFTSSQFPDSAVVRVIFSGASLAVMLYWGWWWFAQRIHFSGGTGL